jgi:hypothetical protein
MTRAICSVDTSGHHNGLQLVHLENDLVSVAVLPQLGAKIWSFIHRPSATDLLWHNPRLGPAPVHYGAKFDDNWPGGWDELIPTDIPYAFSNGDVLPDHGEVWSQCSDWRVVNETEEGVTVTFVTHGRVLPTRFEKELTLRPDEPVLRLRYSYTNQGPRPIQFLWNIHPPLAISPATRLDVPAQRCFVEAWMNEQFAPGLEYQWPYAPDRTGQKIDLRVLPSAMEAVADHHYFPNVKEGWYAATDTTKRVGFGMVFPTQVFPHLWMFRALGGWRGLNTLILEVSNGYPSDLRKAIEAGTCGVVEPGDTVRAEVLALAYAGVSGVDRIDPSGQVHPRLEQEL